MYYKNFQEIITLRGITPYSIAKKTKISTGTLSDWKTGRSTPKVDKLMKIADCLGVPLEDLIKEETKTG